MTSVGRGPGLVIAGCGGAMGRAVAKCAADRGMTIVGAFERPGAALIGEDVSVLTGGEIRGVAIAAGAAAAMAPGTVVVDFTAAAASVAAAAHAAAVGAAMVIGTTGFAAEEETEIRRFAETIPIVKSGNMSLGVNLLCALAEQAAAALAERYDIEILEIHHRRKVDAPSGTALMLGAAAASGRGVQLKDKTAPLRETVRAPRKPGDIGFAVIRGGGVVGEHEAIFAGEREVVTLSHKALDRALFAEGAIAAASWVSGRSPGLYSMRDVLGV